MVSQLKWDTSSDQWKNATWSEDAMELTYWEEKDGKVGDKQLCQTATVFKVPWDVEPCGAGGEGTATTLLDQNRVFSFDLNAGYNAPNKAFPYEMVF